MLIIMPNWYTKFKQKRIINFIDCEITKESSYKYKRIIKIIYQSIEDIECMLTYRTFIDEEEKIRYQEIYNILKELKSKCKEVTKNKQFTKKDLKLLLSIFK